MSRYLLRASVATSNGDNYCIIWSQNKNIGTSCPPQKLFLQSSCLGTTEPLPAIQLGYEIRSATVHEKMMEMWKSNFIVKTVSKSKMDVKYQHPNIHLYMMDLKAPLIPEVEATDDNGNDDEEVVSNLGEDEDNGLKSESCSGSSPEAKSGSLDDWEIRRCGAMAARLLKDVKL
ncbi:Tumor protein [Zea mays]|uniref:Tumor protein n=1 Tax=Zea mays TaxID=4577 RepID=A0A1D6QAU0_MAIZE|nr:Tumor protein [Zea mays]